MTNDSAYISTREAADMLGISLRTAQLWVESGVLTAWKTTGGHRRILLNSVEKLLKERDVLQQSGQYQVTHKKKLLIVEDDSDLVLLIQMSIASFNLDLDIFTARNGFEGLLAIGQTRPDILIADLNMPGMDGFKMLQSVEGSDLAPETIIICTALSPSDIENRGGLPARCNILEKPFSFLALEQLIKSKMNVK
jgi:excisionase family DNA binding protein